MDAEPRFTELEERLMAQIAIREKALDLAIDHLVAIDAGGPVVGKVEIASALAQIAQAQQLKRIADALDTGDAAPFVVQVIP